MSSPSPDSTLNWYAPRFCSMNFAGSMLTAILGFRQLRGGSQQTVVRGQAAILLAQLVNIACSLPCILVQPACMPHSLARQHACLFAPLQQALPCSQPAAFLPLLAWHTCLAAAMFHAASLHAFHPHQAALVLALRLDLVPHAVHLSTGEGHHAVPAPGMPQGLQSTPGGPQRRQALVGAHFQGVPCSMCQRLAVLCCYLSPAAAVGSCTCPNGMSACHIVGCSGPQRWQVCPSSRELSTQSGTASPLSRLLQPLPCSRCRSKLQYSCRSDPHFLVPQTLLCLGSMCPFQGRKPFQLRQTQHAGTHLCRPPSALGGAALQGRRRREPQQLPGPAVRE